MADDAMDVEAPQGSFGMDVEVSASDQSSISPESVQNARRVVVSFLKEHKAEEVVPSNSRVVVIDSSVRLRHAFRSLLDNGIRAAPVVDVQTLKFVGMLTVSDVIDCLRHFYYNTPDRNVSRGLEEHTIASWRSMSGTTDFTADFRYADAEGSLYDACRILRDHHIHRLPIVSNRNLLLCTLEHWRVLRFVHEHLTGQEPSQSALAIDLLNMTLAQLGIGTYRDIVTVRLSDSLLHALETMAEQNLSAVPVVDESMSLCNVYSRTDVTVLSRLDSGDINLDQPLSEALAPIRTPDFCVHTCRRSDPLGVVFERFERTRKHRLYAVSDHGVVEGVISLSDLLAYFLQGS